MVLTQRAHVSDISFYAIYYNRFYGPGFYYDSRDRYHKPRNWYIVPLLFHQNYSKPYSMEHYLLWLFINTFDFLVLVGGKKRTIAP